MAENLTESIRPVFKDDSAGLKVTGKLNYERRIRNAGRRGRDFGA